MEPYWEQDYLINEEKHNVKLYKYSQNSVCLISTTKFGKSFSKSFKTAGGRFNPNLKIDEVKTPGWIFRSNIEVLEKLNNILKEIYEGNIKAEFNIIKPDFNNKNHNNEIFNLISKLSKLISEDTEEYILSNADGVKTTIYHNPDEETVTEGDLVYKFEGGNKILEIYQLVDKEL